MLLSFHDLSHDFTKKNRITCIFVRIFYTLTYFRKVEKKYYVKCIHPLLRNEKLKKKKNWIAAILRALQKEQIFHAPLIPFS